MPQSNSGLFCSCSRDYPGLLQITLTRSAPLCVWFRAERSEWAGILLIILFKFQWLVIEVILH